MRTRRTSLHALVGAYVLDAIPEPDRAGFERHLLTCEQCRDDVRGLRAAAALLAAAAAVTPRPELRGPTLQAAAVTRQLPPPVGGTSPARRTWRRRLPAAGIGRPWLAAVAGAVAVLLAVTAVVLGVHMAGMQRNLAAQERRDGALSAILGAHDAVVLTAAVTTGGTATVVMSHHARALIFTASGLPKLPGSRGYELWLAGPAGTRSAGMLPPRRHGMTGPMIVGRLAPGDSVELTVEPVGGSSHPTSAPLVWLYLGP